MKTVIVLAVFLIPSLAIADGGFYGGMADGMNRSRELRLQERALEREIQLQRQQREIEENRRKLKEIERERFQRRYGPNPKPDSY